MAAHAQETTTTTTATASNEPPYGSIAEELAAEELRERPWNVPAVPPTNVVWPDWPAPRAQDVSWRGLPWGSVALLTAINDAERQTPIAAAKALSGWCALASLAPGTDAGDVATEQCLAWSDAIGSLAEREAIVGDAYLALVDSVRGAANDDERRQRLWVFIARFSDVPGGEVGAAEGALRAINAGKPFANWLWTEDLDDDGIVADLCPNAPGVRAESGCPAYDTSIPPDHPAPPGDWDIDLVRLGFGLPAADVGVGVVGQLRLADNDAEVDVAATSLSVSFRLLELRLNWPGLDVGARGAPIGGSLLLTPFTWMLGRDDGDIYGIGLVAPVVGVDAYGDRDGAFRDVGVVVGNTFSLTEAFNVRLFYRHSVFGQVDERPHHVGVQVWVNVISLLRALDDEC